MWYVRRRNLFDNCSGQIFALNYGLQHAAGHKKYHDKNFLATWVTPVGYPNVNKKSYKLYENVHRYEAIIVNQSD